MNAFKNFNETEWFSNLRPLKFGDGDLSTRASLGVPLKDELLSNSVELTGEYWRKHRWENDDCYTSKYHHLNPNYRSHEDVLQDRIDQTLRFEDWLDEQVLDSDTL